MTLFRVTGTILVRDHVGRFLITQRSLDKKHFPGKWTIPGGGLEREDFINLPSQFQPNQWYNVFEDAMRRELWEETGLTAGPLRPITDLVFLLPDGTPVIVFSVLGEVRGSFEVRLNEESMGYAWVTAEEAQGFDLIPGILHEIELAAKMGRI